MTSKIIQIIACIIQKKEYSTGKDENNLPEDMEIIDMHVVEQVLANQVEQP